MLIGLPPLGVISASTSGVSGINREDFTIALDVTGFTPLQVKHGGAEPKILLTHIQHLLNELDRLVAVVGPGPGVMEAFGAAAEVMIKSSYFGTWIVKN